MIRKKWPHSYGWPLKPTFTAVCSANPILPRLHLEPSLSLSLCNAFLHWHASLVMHAFYDDIMSWVTSLSLHLHSSLDMHTFYDEIMSWVTL